MGTFQSNKGLATLETNENVLYDGFQRFIVKHVCYDVSRSILISTLLDIIRRHRPKCSQLNKNTFHYSAMKVTSALFAHLNDNESDGVIANDCIHSYSIITPLTLW